MEDVKPRSVHDEQGDAGKQLRIVPKRQAFEIRHTAKPHLTQTELLQRPLCHLHLRGLARSRTQWVVPASVLESHGSASCENATGLPNKNKCTAGSTFCTCLGLWCCSTLSRLHNSKTLWKLPATTQKPLALAEEGKHKGTAGFTSHLHQPLKFSRTLGWTFVANSRGSDESDPRRGTHLHLPF